MLYFQRVFDEMLYFQGLICKETKKIVQNYIDIIPDPFHNFFCFVFWEFFENIDLFEESALDKFSAA
jgi:hypothetical protein